jgi:integrase
MRMAVRSLGLLLMAQGYQSAKICQYGIFTRCFQVLCYLPAITWFKTLENALLKSTFVLLTVFRSCTTMLTESEAAMKYWTPEELLRILAEAKNVSARNHLCILLAYKFALRASELCRLTVKDVQNGRIHCQRLKNSLPLDQPLESDPNPLLDEQRALRVWLRERDGEGPWLFTGRVSQAARERMAARRTSAKEDRSLDVTPVTGISRFTITDIFEDACMKAGIEPARRSPHKAKHTAGKHGHNAGLDVFELRQLLGHRDIKSTSFYVEITQDEAHAKMSARRASLFASAA